MEFHIGDKVRYIGLSSDNRYFPPVGTIGVVRDVTTGGASCPGIKWPTGTIGFDIAFASDSFLELVEAEEEEEPRVCSDCGRVIEGGEEYHTLSSGRIVCEDCIENYYYCDSCEQCVECDTMEIDGECVCEDCLDRKSHIYFQCDCCGEWVNRRTMSWYTVYNSEEICENCRDDDYTYCYDCDELYPNDDIEYIDGNPYCPQCVEDHRRAAINSYSYKPNPIFKTAHDVFYYSNDVKELMFGVELEIDHGEDPEECAADMADACEDIYCKHDGSLDEGIEIVTHPCSLEYHLKQLGWDTIAGIALDYGFVSHAARTCGMHVHVGRYQFGNTWEERDEVSAKLVMLADRHWDNLLKFSRRKSDQLRWANRPHVEYESDALRTAENALNTRRDGRYQAVNLCNDKTVEFRIFNGSLNVNTIFATLEFVSNLVRYAMTHTVEEVMASQWDDIINVEHYDELTKYLDERNIVAERIAEIQFRERLNPQVGDIVRCTTHDPGFNYDHMCCGEEAMIARVTNEREVLLVFEREDWRWHRNGELRDNVAYNFPIANLELVRRPEGAERDMILGYIDYEMYCRSDDPLHPTAAAIQPGVTWTLVSDSIPFPDAYAVTPMADWTTPIARSAAGAVARDWDLF